MNPEPEHVTLSPAADQAEAAPAIDIEALAERVYRLMLQDLRLDRARRGASEDKRRIRQ